MAHKYWTGNAVNVADICTLTASGTWVAGETGTLTINGKNLVVTAGTAVTPTDIATLIAAAVNASDRLSSATSGSSNVGGQSIPEFAELIATSSGAVVTLTTRDSKFHGKPFQGYLTRSDTASSGAIGAVTSVQTATGRNWWSNAGNWADGSVPANGDTVHFATPVDCLYGLPNNSLELAGVIVYNSFANCRLGLWPINRDNASKPYTEFRTPRYPTLDNAASGTVVTHRIGVGDGPGPALVNLCQNDLATTFEVDSNNPSPADPTQRVINLIAPDGGVLRVRKGNSIDVSNQNGETANWTAITIAGRKAATNDIDILSRGNASAACAVNQLGGKLTIDWASWTSNGLTLVGGEAVVYTAAIPAADVSEGTLTAINTGTIASLTLNRAGHFDVSRSSSAITVTNATYYSGSKVTNPAKRITHTNPIALRGLLKDMDLDYGFNRTLQIAG